MRAISIPSVFKFIFLFSFLFLYNNVNAQTPLTTDQIRDINSYFESGLVNTEVPVPELTNSVNLNNLNNQLLARAILLDCPTEGQPSGTASVSYSSNSGEWKGGYTTFKSASDACEADIKIGSDKNHTDWFNFIRCKSPSGFSCGEKCNVVYDPKSIICNVQLENPTGDYQPEKKGNFKNIFHYNLTDLSRILVCVAVGIPLDDCGPTQKAAADVKAALKKEITTYACPVSATGPYFSSTLNTRVSVTSYRFSIDIMVENEYVFRCQNGDGRYKYKAEINGTKMCKANVPAPNVNKPTVTSISIIKTTLGKRLVLSGSDFNKSFENLVSIVNANGDGVTVAGDVSADGLSISFDLPDSISPGEYQIYVGVIENPNTNPMITSGWSDPVPFIVVATNPDLASTYEEWKGIVFTSTQNTDANSDPDKDGLSNIWEYALGTNPLVLETGKPIQSFIFDNRFTFQYQLNKNRTDINTRIGATNNLFGGTWDYNAMTTTSENITVNTNLNTSIDTVLVSSINGGRYFRLELIASNNTSLSKLSLTPSNVTYSKLSVTKIGNGVVMSKSNDINCGSKCTTLKKVGSIELLNATPATGYKFDGWTGDCDASFLGGCSVTISLNNNKSVQALFSKIPPPTTPILSSITVVDQSKSVDLKNKENKLNINWKDVSDNEDGFIVERSIWSFPKIFTNFVKVGSVGSNMTSFIDTLDKKNDSFIYRIKAYNSGGDSGYSNLMYVDNANKKNIKVYSNSYKNINSNSASVVNSGGFSLIEWLASLLFSN